MSIQHILSSHVTPGTLPRRVTTGTASGEFLISSGALLSPSLVTPGALAHASHTRSSCPVTSLLELSPSHDSPGALAQLCHSLSYCPFVSLLELLQANLYVPTANCFRVAPGALAQSFRFLYSCPLLSFLELLPSHVTPCAIALSCHSWNACR